VGAEPVAVIPDDLPEVVDASRKGAGGGVGIVESGVSAAAEEEPMNDAAGIGVSPDDLAGSVDAVCRPTPRQQIFKSSP